MNSNTPAISIFKRMFVLIISLNRTNNIHGSKIIIVGKINEIEPTYEITKTIADTRETAITENSPFVPEVIFDHVDRISHIDNFKLRIRYNVVRF